MPDHALAVSETIRNIINSTRPGTPCNELNVAQFAALIRMYLKHKVLDPNDLCIALHYTEVVFATLMQARASNPEPHWTNQYPIDTTFNHDDALICTTILYLTTHGTLGQDVPFNAYSVLLCFNSQYKLHVAQAGFNRTVVKVLELLDFTLPRDLERINYYTELIFIKPPSAIPPTDPEMKPNAATAVPQIFHKGDAPAPGPSKTYNSTNGTL